MTVGLESLFVLVLADLLFSLFYDAAHYRFLSLAVLLFLIVMARCGIPPPNRRIFQVVGRAGIEPATNGLKVRCSTA